MFKFNFNSDSDESVKEKPAENEEKSLDKLKESVKIEFTSDQYREVIDIVKEQHVNCFESNKCEIGYLDNTLLTDKSDTDLIPRVYEGGFKIWECTQDLADLLTGSADNEFSGKIVCDLGCSAGVLGIIALINNAAKVDFQDYVSLIVEMRRVVTYLRLYLILE